MSNANTKTMTSFSGSDLIVTFGKKVIGELTSISWAITRKKAPVYSLGKTDPVSFSRGIRGIAGSMSFNEFDHDTLMEEIKSIWDTVAPDAMFTAQGNLIKLNTDDFAKAIKANGWNGTNDVLENQFAGNEEWNRRTTEAFNAANSSAPAGFARIQKDNILYVDTLPPFDITLTFANEYGQAAFRKIYDVDILNEGSGVSVESTIMEREVTYIARRISPLVKGNYDRERA